MDNIDGLIMDKDFGELRKNLRDKSVNNAT
jgi:hypothetical protein